MDRLVERVLVEDAKFIASFRGVKNKYFFLASPSLFSKKICKTVNFPTHHTAGLVINLNLENTIPWENFSFQNAIVIDFYHHQSSTLINKAVDYYQTQ